MVAKPFDRNSVPRRKNPPTLAFSLPVFVLKQAEMIPLICD